MMCKWYNNIGDRIIEILEEVYKVLKIRKGYDYVPKTFRNKKQLALKCQLFLIAISLFASTLNSTLSIFDLFIFFLHSRHILDIFYN